VKTEVLPISDSGAIRYAANVLQRNGLVAFPTDTVYGVGALAFQAEAVEKLYTIKERSKEKAIPVLIAHPADLKRVAGELTPTAQRLAEKFWPGPLTLVVSKQPSLPEAVSAAATVGVRVPDQPLTQQLLELTGPLAVTSANLSGAPAALTADEVLAQLSGRIELLLDGGRVLGGQPSTVVDCSGATFTILRVGPISASDINQALIK
jgi:L-threonylcarbamoyladenylate synthase